MLRCEDLVRLSEEQLAVLDIAETNLACAMGLPDAGGVDVAGCIRRLDEMAEYTRHFTMKMLPLFLRSPEEYNRSSGYFCTLCMITALQQDLGVRYNPEKKPVDVPLATADIFIHGAILGAGGTCASLPVLYTAVGRRLGYPLKLVQARVGGIGHLFARWHSPSGERFNIEGTNCGLSCPPDPYYRTGIYAVDPVVERKARLLVSMAAKEELAVFLGERGHRWMDFGKLRNAVQSFAWAAELTPENICFKNTLREVKRMAEIPACGT